MEHNRRDVLRSRLACQEALACQSLQCRGCHRHLDGCSAWHCWPLAGIHGCRWHARYWTCGQVLRHRCSGRFVRRYLLADGASSGCYLLIVAWVGATVSLAGRTLAWWNRRRNV